MADAKHEREEQAGKELGDDEEDGRAGGGHVDGHQGRVPRVVQDLGSPLEDHVRHLGGEGLGRLDDCRGVLQPRFDDLRAPVHPAEAPHERD